MAKFSGKDLITDPTEKNGRRLLIISFMVLVIKLYEVNLKELSLFGLKLPTELFDISAVALILYFTYALTINWLTDLASFKLWFKDNSGISTFGGKVELDWSHLKGGSDLLVKLYAMENCNGWPVNYTDMDEEVKNKFVDFKTNVELYCTRLDDAKSRFSSLTKIGHIYVWFQSYLLPMFFALSALCVLYIKGSFVLPT